MTDYEILPEGKYKARAIEGGLGESKNGNAQAAVLFRITGGDRDGDTITWYGSFSKNKGEGTKTPLQRTVETLRACGWSGDDISDLSSIAESNEIDVGLVVEHSEWEGKMQAKVKWVNRGGGLGLTTPMKPDSAKAFAAKMRGEILAASKGIKPAAKSANGGAHPNAPGSSYGPPADREPGEDDLGF